MKLNNKSIHNPAAGSIGLYVIVFLLVGLMLSVFLFFPQFLNMQSGIYNISCREIRKKVKIAVEDHDANNTRAIGIPGQPVDLDYLVEKGYLAEVQLCPENGTYFIGENGEIVCSFHKKEND
jgi:competence protein ComGC